MIPSDCVARPPPSATGPASTKPPAPKLGSGAPDARNRATPVPAMPGQLPDTRMRPSARRTSDERRAQTGIANEAAHPTGSERGVPAAVRQVAHEAPDEAPVPVGQLHEDHHAAVELDAGVDRIGPVDVVEHHSANPERQVDLAVGQAASQQQPASGVPMTTIRPSGAIRTGPATSTPLLSIITVPPLPKLASRAPPTAPAVGGETIMNPVASTSATANGRVLLMLSPSADTGRNLRCGATSTGPSQPSNEIRGGQ